MSTTPDPQTIASLRDQFGDEGWWLLDRPAQGLTFGTKTRELLGLTDNRLELTVFLASLQAEDRPDFLIHLEALFSGQFSEFHALVTPLGHPHRRIMLRAWQISGAPQRLFGTAIDATDRVSDRHQVRMQAGFLRDLINTMPVVISVMSLEGENLELLGDMHAVSGWTPAEALGNRDFQFVWHEDRHLVYAAQEAMRAGDCTERTLEFRIVHRTGEPVWVEARGYLRDGFGPQPVVVAYHYPIDRLKQAQGQLEQAVAERTAELRATVEHLNAEVEERTRIAELLRQREQQLIRGATRQALGTLIAGVVHELRSPLSTVQLGLEVLAERSTGTEQTAIIERLSEAVGHALAVIDQLRETTTDRPQQTIGPVDLASAATAALGLAEHALRRSGVVIERNLVAGRVVVNGSHRRLVQVILNLVVNALQALPAGGGTVSITVLADAKGALCRISDSGCGMSPEVLGRLGEPFFTTRHQEGGQGLGVAVCLGIVQEHGGSLDFSSQSGLGTTASLRLPHTLRAAS